MKSKLTFAKKFKSTIIAWLGVTASAFAICGLTTFVFKILDVSLPPQKSLEAVLNSRGWRLALNVAAVLVIAPIFEELIFRGLLFKLIIKFFKSRFAVDGCMIFSATAFCAAHYWKGQFPDNAFIALFYFGIAQCILYRKTNSIWCPMLLHFLFNATNLVLLFCFPDMAK
jgi:membrane protease YdiL (CAAX protease family)